MGDVVMNKSRWKFALLLLSSVLAACSTLSANNPPLIDLQNIEQLKAQFNSDNGQARILLLLSPT